MRTVESKRLLEVEQFNHMAKICLERAVSKLSISPKSTLEIRIKHEAKMMGYVPENQDKIFETALNL